MVRKSMWVAFAALLACASGALAYEYDIDQTPSGSYTYASELFGAGSATSRIDYDGDGPRITLWTVLDTDANEMAIRNDHTMEITIRLANAQFASNFRSTGVTSLYYVDDRRTVTTSNDAVTTRRVRVDRLEGGTAGSSWVTFEATATTGWDGTAVGSTNATLEMRFEMPPLTALNTRAVTATVEVDAGGGSGFLSSESSDVTITTVADGEGTTRYPNSGVLQLTMPPAPTSTSTTRPPVPLVTFQSALTFTASASGGGMSDIDITGDRLQVDKYHPMVANQSRLATVRVGVPSNTVKQLDGQIFSIASRQDGEGDLTVSVTGEFHEEGDVVFLDLDGDNNPDANEMLEMDEGVMSQRFPLTAVAGNAANRVDSNEGERQRAEGEATRTLIFRSNGEDTLRPATYTSTFAVDFDEENNADKAGQSVAHMTRYYAREGSNQIFIGDSLTRHAYAIPPLGSGDEGTVRVKCETATACPVYLECDDSAGMSWFSELREGIDSRATLVLDSETIATHLDVGDDGWNGRLSCLVMSTRDISLQVLTRSGGALINNTFVDN